MLWVCSSGCSVIGSTFLPVPPPSPTPGPERAAYPFTMCHLPRAPSPVGSVAVGYPCLLPHTPYMHSVLVCGSVERKRRGGGRGKEPPAVFRGADNNM